MRRYRSIISTVGALVAVSALTLTTPAASRAPVPVNPTLPGCPDAEGFTTGESLDDIRPVYVGVWIRCSSVSVLPDLLESEVGVELAADGTWHRIFHGADGTLLRGQGIDHEGTWVLQAPMPGEAITTEHLQLDLHGLYGFHQVTMSTLTTTPEVLVLDDGMGKRAGGYERWTGDPPAASAPASQPFPGCPAASGSRSFTSTVEARTTLAGTWIRCSSTSAFPSGWNTGEVGLELTVDGRWYIRVLDDGGMPTSSTSPVQSGTYTVILQGTAVLVSFTATDQSMVPTFVTYLAQPTFLYVVGYPNLPAGYVPWDGNPLPIVPPTR